MHKLEEGIKEGMYRTSGPTYDAYPLSNYEFGVKEAQPEKDTSVSDRMNRMKENYRRFGMRRSVEAVLVVNVHNHPHVLLLQIGGTFFKLPGGRCRPGENELDCLKRKLVRRLDPEGTSDHNQWVVAELIATWYRTSFDPTMFPYCPAHVTLPKEIKKLYFIALPEHRHFAVPKNFKLLSFPLFELYDTPRRFGSAIAKIPEALARFNFNFIQPMPEEKNEENKISENSENS